MKQFASFVVFILLAAVTASSARALEIPNFPSCLNPSGSVKVSYSSGVHGIVGNSGEFVGSDIVYTVSDTQLTQCFCAASGSGIQTDWWKAGSLNQSQVDQLAKLGWIFVADGSAWGLDNSGYFAKNTSYSCLGGNGGNGGSSQPGPGPAPVCTAAKPGSTVLTGVDRSSTSAKLTWTAADKATHYIIFYGSAPGSFQHSVLNTGNVTSFTVTNLDPNQKYYFEVRAVNDCMPGDPAGQVLGASTAIGGGEVLGLAATGNNWVVYALIGLGLLFIIAGLYVRRHEQI